MRRMILMFMEILILQFLISSGLLKMQISVLLLRLMPTVHGML